MPTDLENRMDQVNTLLNSLIKFRIFLCSFSGDAKFYWSFLSGLVCGSFSALIVTPLDVMKTRIQTVTKAKGDKSYSSVFSAFR